MLHLTKGGAVVAGVSRAVGFYFVDCLEKEPTHWRRSGGAVSAKAPEAVEKRARRAWTRLTEERSSLLEDEAKHSLAAKRDEERLSEPLGAAARRRRRAPSGRLAHERHRIQESSGRDLLHELDQQVESVVGRSASTRGYEKS